MKLQSVFDNAFAPFGRVLAGLYESVPQACSAVVRTSAPSLPSAEAGACYRRVHEVYRALYPALRDTFGALTKL